MPEMDCYSIRGKGVAKADGNGSIRIRILGVLLPEFVKGYVSISIIYRLRILRTVQRAWREQESVQTHSCSSYVVALYIRNEIEAQFTASTRR